MLGKWLELNLSLWSGLGFGLVLGSIMIRAGVKVMFRVGLGLGQVWGWG